MTSIKVLKTVICDDVRIENTGKYILIGVYTSNSIVMINIPYPFIFSCYIEVTANTTGILSGNYRVVDSSGEELIRGDLQVFVSGDVPISCYLAALQIFIERVGTYTLQWKLADADWQTITTFKIEQKQQPFMTSGDPTASWPPSEQSRRDARPS